MYMHMGVDGEVIMIVELYSHFFKVLNEDYRHTVLLDEYTRKFLYRVTFRPSKFNKYQKEPDPKLFAIKLENNYEYRFHINLIGRFMHFLKLNGVDESQVKIIPAPVYTPAILDTTINPEYQARDYQVPIIDYIKSDGNSKLVQLQTGQGKAVPLHTLVQVPTGWKFISELNIHDDVITATGRVTTVLRIYELYMQHTYKVTLEDGRFLKCCNYHLWKVYVSGVSMIVTADELYDMYHDSNEIHIDSIVPYSNTRSNNTDNIIEYLKLNMNKSDCHIPLNVYDMSVHDRRCIIEQLSSNNTIHVYDRSMAKQLQKLCWSMGYICKIQEHSGYDVIYTISNKIQVTNVIMSTPEKGRCIYIKDSSSQYVVDDYLACHNTYIALQSAIDINYRTAVIVKPMFLEKWYNDILTITTSNVNDILMVVGGKQIRGLISAGINNAIPSKFIIISSRSLIQYLEMYEKFNSDLDYAEMDVPPERLMETLGVGTIIMDEIHQAFHAVVKTLLHMNVPKIIGLSATLTSDDPRIKEYQNMVFPIKSRYYEPVRDKYISALFWVYNFEEPNKVKHIEQSTGMYNHTTFEKSIMKYDGMLRRYIQMVREIIDLLYTNKKLDNQKCLIFVATVRMASFFTVYFSNIYDDLKVNRYVEDDPYENIINSDICITTPGSGGTGIDIPGLILVIQTVAMNSIIGNIQNLGRLRKNNSEVTYVCTVCSQLHHHHRYTQKRNEIFKQYAKGIRAQHHNTLI